MKWQRDVAIACACAVAGVLVHLASLPAPLATVGLGIGLVAASMLLGWAADAGDAVFSGGLVLAVIALLAVLPEFVIEARFAYIGEAELVTANLTGATRLLLTGAVGLPLAVAVFARRKRQAAAPLELAPSRRLELRVLLIAGLFTVQIILRGKLTVFDGLVLVALYAYYARRVQGAEDEDAAVLGVPAGLVSLPAPLRRPVIAALALIAGSVVIMIANPFADALLETGTSLGIDPYFLIQSVVPVASEAPEFIVVAVLVANRRPAQALAVLLASPVSQWTLALGGLPIAFFAGGNGPAMPLDAQQQLDVGFAIALTLFAVAALVTLRPERVDAMLATAALALHFLFPTPFVLTASTFVCFVFACSLFLDRRRALRALFRRPGRA